MDQEPDGSIGLVTSPTRPRTHRRRGGGPAVRHQHSSQVVVTDFNLPSARVFTGFEPAPSGEEGNGDHLIQIDDRVATSYAIEASACRSPALPQPHEGSGRQAEAERAAAADTSKPILSAAN
jgi:hypothetical protein